MVAKKPNGPEMSEKKELSEELLDEIESGNAEVFNIFVRDGHFENLVKFCEAKMRRFPLRVHSASGLANSAVESAIRYKNRHPQRMNDSLEILAVAITIAGRKWSRYANRQRLEETYIENQKNEKGSGQYVSSGEVYVELKDSIEFLLTLLNEDQCEVFLRKFLGQTIKEIAAELKVPPNIIQKHWNAIRKILEPHREKML